MAGEIFCAIDLWPWSLHDEIRGSAGTVGMKRALATSNAHYQFF